MRKLLFGAFTFTALTITMALTTLTGSWVFAETAPRNNAVVAVAEMSIVSYGLFRIQDLGAAFGNVLGQNQICSLAGQAFTGLLVLEAAGVSDKELEGLLKRQPQSGLTADLIRSTLKVDIKNCAN